MAWIEDLVNGVLLVRQAAGFKFWTLPGGKVESLALVITCCLSAIATAGVLQLAYASNNPADHSVGDTVGWAMVFMSPVPLPIFVVLSIAVAAASYHFVLRSRNLEKGHRPQAACGRTSSPQSSQTAARRAQRLPPQSVACRCPPVKDQAHNSRALPHCLAAEDARSATSRCPNHG
jgi:hypothetical protein